MAAPLKPFTTLVDFVTGREVPNIGAEENRQAVERLLVEQKGYDREEIEVEVPIPFVDVRTFVTDVDGDNLADPNSLNKLWAQGTR